MSSSAQLLNADSLKQWTSLIPGRNVLHLLSDYLLLALLHTCAIGLFLQAEAWQIPRWSLVLVAVVTVIFTGCLLHRIALIGHEASHFLLLKNRKWNDILTDLLCFFPLWSTLVSYRQKHQGHHLHPNEPGRDPNLGSEKAEQLFASFPMERPSCISRYYALFFWPPFVLRNLIDLIHVLAFGNGRKTTASKAAGQEGGVRVSPLVLGIVYLVVFRALLALLEGAGIDGWMVVTVPVLFHALVGVGGTILLPRHWYRKLETRRTYDFKVAAVLRLTLYAGLLAVIAWGRHFLGFNYGPFYALFWLLPLLYVFPYLMLLREVYQHANLGTGKLDNSRIIHVDPFTRWALLSYGNDFHLIHHIYPNIPHYHLRSAHRQLVEESPEYRSRLEECHGTLHAPSGSVSVADALAEKGGMERGHEAPA